MKSRSRKERRPIKKAIGGPFLTMAVICEKVLREKDDVQSLIRVFDRLMLRELPAQDATGEKVRMMAPFTMVIGFKSGDFVGTKNVKIRLVGRDMPEKSTQVVFTGNEGGPVIVSEIALEVKKAELLWFEICLDDQLLTRVPLRIVFEEASPTDQSPASPSRKRLRPH